MGEVFLIRHGGFKAFIKVTSAEAASISIKFGGSTVATGSVTTAGGSTTFKVRKKGAYSVVATSTKDSLQKTYSVNVAVKKNTYSVSANFNSTLFNQSGTGASSLIRTIVSDGVDVGGYSNVTSYSLKLTGGNNFICTKNMVDVSKYSKLVIKLNNVSCVGGSRDDYGGSSGPTVYGNSCVFGLSTTQYWRGRTENTWKKVDLWSTSQKPSGSFTKELDISGVTGSVYIGFGIGVYPSWSGVTPTVNMNIASIELVR